MKSCIKHIDEDHAEMIMKKTAYQQSVKTAEKDRQERHKAQLVHNIVVQNEKANLNRARRQPKKSLLQKETQPEKSTSGTLAATNDFVEVSASEQKKNKKKKTGGVNEETPRVPVSRAQKKRWRLILCNNARGRYDIAHRS